MFASVNGIHPMYVQKMRGKGIHKEKIVEKLLSIPEEKRDTYKEGLT